MYVAVTRARKRLYLSWAQTRMLHGQTRYCVASSFFDEIPDELLRRINPVTVAQSSRPTYEAPHAGGGGRGQPPRRVPAKCRAGRRAVCRTV